MEKADVQRLETRIDELVRCYNQLLEENRILRESQADLIAERDALREKNTLACNRVESMITRLKSIEIDL